MRAISATWFAVSSAIGSVVVLATIVLMSTGIAAASGLQVHVPGLVTAVPGAETGFASTTVDRTGGMLWFVAVVLSLALVEHERAPKKKIGGRSLSNRGAQ